MRAKGAATRAASGTFFLGAGMVLQLTAFQSLNVTAVFPALGWGRDSTNLVNRSFTFRRQPYFSVKFYCYFFRRSRVRSSTEIH